MLKKLIACVLSIIMVLGGVVTVFADEGVTWAIEENEGNVILHFSGTGAMGESDAWSEYKDSVNSVIIDDGVQSVSGNAFNGFSKLESVSIPASVTEIGMFSFKACNKIEKIILPEGVTTVPVSAFADCAGLKEIILSANLEVIDVSAFENCINLEKIQLPDSLKSIGFSAFAGCESMTEISIPEGVNSIGMFAFQGCNNLKEVAIYGKNTSIQMGVFEGASEVTIKCWKDSVAETYAKENNIKYEYLDGEVNPPTSVLPFTDVAEDSWCFEPVKYVYEHHIMNGMRSDYFGVTDLLSRAQFATVLYNVAKPTGVIFSQKYPDVSESDWFGLPVSWASETGIITGYENGYFGSADNITREQIAVMLYRYAQYFKYDTSKKADFSTYPDAYQVSDWATEAMQWAVGNGIISGRAGTYLDPTGNASRAECATMISRFMQKFVEA